MSKKVNKEKAYDGTTKPGLPSMWSKRLEAIAINDYAQAEKLILRLQHLWPKVLEDSPDIDSVTFLNGVGRYEYNIVRKSCKGRVDVRKYAAEREFSHILDYFQYDLQALRWLTPFTRKGPGRLLPLKECQHALEQCTECGGLRK